MAQQELGNCRHGVPGGGLDCPACRRALEAALSTPSLVWRLQEELYARLDGILQSLGAILVLVILLLSWYCHAGLAHERCVELLKTSQDAPAIMAVCR